MSLLLWFFASWLKPHVGRCATTEYVANVRPDGVYRCRARPPRYEPPQERRGVIVDDMAPEHVARVYCRSGERPVWQGPQQVGCVKV